MIPVSWRVEHIATAPRDMGRDLVVILEGGEEVRALWWRHWSMAEGVWWCFDYGVIDPIAWYRDERT